MNTDRPLSQPTADLERSLANLTAPATLDTAREGLWLKALDQAAPTSAPKPLWNRRILRPWMAAAASLLIMVLIAGILLPAIPKSRSVSSSPPPPPASAAASGDTVGAVTYSMSTTSKFSESDGVPAWYEQSRRVPVTEQPANTPPPQTPVADRHVIRKSTLDLTATDVRGVFNKAGLIVNNALGEYVEASSLTGEGPTAYGTLTIRVASSRLSEALNQLRPLGTVISEATTGQDVTDAVVDLDARIRNEQRIEKELVALVDKRPDAPLKDLMEIRTQLSDVRGQIESLMGQRDRIGRQVSLATILITIKTADAKPADQPKPAGIGAYFKSAVADAWTNALQALADTAAFLIRTLIGGIFWWLLTIFIAAAAWKLSKRLLARIGAEPAPVA